jgi:hypothetical protein
MDALGEVPYLEQLRREGRFDEVHDLGVEREEPEPGRAPSPRTCRHQIAPGPLHDLICGSGHGDTQPLLSPHLN